jgi:hypothetical protein
MVPAIAILNVLRFAFGSSKSFSLRFRLCPGVLLAPCRKKLHNPFQRGCQLTDYPGQRQRVLPESASALDAERADLREYLWHKVLIH